MKKIIAPIFILLVLISCEKEEEKTPVIAGETNAEMLLYEFNPAMKIELQTDSANNIKYGHDSLDINLDGRYDLFFDLKLFIDWQDTLRLDFFYFNTRLLLKNGLGFITKIETYYVGLGVIKDFAWADTINSGSIIDRKAEWSGTDTYLAMWTQPPPSTLSNGCWYNVLNEEKYFGFRMKINSTYKYGWIKLIQDSERNIEILSYAIEK